MLTRLKVDGFKNLVDIDVRFGPFTCIAGANGVGKSNLFDAIMFLSALTEKPLLDAAKSVRDEEGRFTDIHSLFHRVGNTYDYDNEMTFEAEMIVPEKGVDDLGQPAKAKITFLRYRLKIGFRADKAGGLELLFEELKHLKLGEASKHLLFDHKAASWRKSAVIGRRSGTAFISTQLKEKERIIKLHADGKGGGRSRSILAANLPRTVLSTVNAAENPTALMAKREMQSWRLLQLEPVALRKPDEITAPTKMGANGAHMAATLYHLPKIKQTIEPEGVERDGTDILSTRVYAQLSNRLTELIDDVRDVSVDYDEKRELLTVMLTGRDGTPHSARSLSDGTLRFLALGVIALDTESSGLICLEEPENGIHPERIPAMLNLLGDIATDVDEPIGLDNPLRQVIINTHSPAIVAQIPDESLLVAERTEMIKNGIRFKAARFCCLSDNWRLKAPEKEKPHTVSRGELLAYLNPVALTAPEPFYGMTRKKAGSTRKRRVIDRSDMRQMLLFAEESQ
jgi:predicted ATPase